MQYITNISSIQNLPDNTDSDDKVCIFCKETDSLKIPEINRLLVQNATIEFVQVSGKDDMLICLGGILAAVDECTFLDNTIPVPQRYADKIHVLKKTEKKPATRRRRKKTEIQTEPQETGETEEHP